MLKELKLVSPTSKENMKFLEGIQSPGVWNGFDEDWLKKQVGSLDENVTPRDDPERGFTAHFAEESKQL